MKWLRWLRDEYRTRRMLRAAVERECRHDGSDPMCWNCTRHAVGW